MASGLLEAAAAAGFSVVADPAKVDLDPKACLLLPPSSGALAVRLAGGVLAVLVSEVPPPALFRELERAAGLPVPLAVAPAEVVAELRSRAGVAAHAWAVEPVLTEAVSAGASDVHLAAGSPPTLRVNGRLRPLKTAPLSADDMGRVAAWVAGEELPPAWPGDLDCAVSFAGQRFRASVWRQRGTLAVTLRLIPAAVPRLEDLGLPVSVTDLAELTSGLVLFCGPTGSGKSTSMASVVDRINRSRSEHILTIEDPVEYMHRDQASLVRQREVGADTASFGIGLRAALRQDPDVILVGELRDAETMQTALTASETGHLVLATVHASSTAQVVNRIVNSFPAAQQDQVRQQLAASLQAVVAQLLLPTAAGDSRVLACEVLVASPAVRNMIRDNRLHELGSVLDTSGATMQSMDRALAGLVTSSKVRLADAERRVYEGVPGRGARTPDEIAVASGLPAGHVLGPLAMLEIAGLVQRQDGLWRLAAQRKHEV